ncbi:MAG TPA: hypothetical protein VJ815_00520 [Acidimicrobiia bacterium]|nr:hypothetical protein [Acidimicrobiia bacterium]
MIAESNLASLSSAEKSIRFVRKLGNFALAGFVAGFIGLGLMTFRGTMRLLTITSGQAGRLTENDNVAGDFTLDGTLFLVGAGAFIGAFVAVLIGIIRPAYSSRAWLTIPIFAPLLTRLLVLSPDNEDFVKFGPGWVAVGGFTLGVAVYLALVEVLTRLLETRWRIPKALGLVIGVGAALLVALGVFSAGVGSVGGIALAVVAAALMVGLWSQGSWHILLARAVAIAAAAFGLITWTQAAIEIA